MDRISGLHDELLVKILSLLPTKEVVSTSVLSKRWESLWLSVPKLDFAIILNESLPIQDFINKNLPLLKPPVIQSFRIRYLQPTFHLLEDIKHWVGITVSRCVRELEIEYLSCKDKPELLLPSSLYTCKSLVTLKLSGNNIVVDVPRTVDLPCLKTLELRCVTFSNKDSLQLLLSCCPVLEDLFFKRYGNDNDEEDDNNVKTIVVIMVPSLLRLSLAIESGCSSDGYVIVTPSLKYFEVEEYYTDNFSYLITHMPMVEEADLIVQEGFERLFESITSVKRLSLFVVVNIAHESMYHYGIVFNHLEHLKLRISHDYWSKLLVRLLEDSPKLRVLKILVDSDQEFEEYEPLSWYNDESSVPRCLLKTLETFEFAGYTGRQEERDFVSYILKNARHLKSSSIKH